MKTQDLYHIKVILLKDLVNVECWNCTDDSTGTIPHGTTIEVCNVHDSTHTTICVEFGKGLTRMDPKTMALKLNNHPDGSKPQNEFGYRFIIPNSLLREATGLPYPEVTRDLVGEIMAAESGELNDEQLIETIKALKADGAFSGLQGWWGRQAARLGL